jgi:hypothetical protein
VRREDFLFARIALEIRRTTLKPEHRDSLKLEDFLTRFKDKPNDTEEGLTPAQIKRKRAEASKAAWFGILGTMKAAKQSKK